MSHATASAIALTTGAVDRRARQQRRLGIHFVEVLDDCERLRDRCVFDDQGRY